MSDETVVTPDTRLVRELEAATHRAEFAEARLKHFEQLAKDNGRTIQDLTTLLSNLEATPPAAAPEQDGV